MKVKCPKCASQYNLDPTKLTAAGVKVRCPSCSHVFALRKKEDGAAPAAASTQGEESAIALDDSAPAGASPPKPAAPSPAAAPAPKSAPPAAAPPPAAGGEPHPEGAFTGEGQWRVKKSGLGLVYGPADFATLESWFRADRVGVQDLYSLDGGPWVAASQFEVVAKKLRIAYQGPARGAAAATPAAPKSAAAPPAAAAKPAPRPAPPSAPATPERAKPVEFAIPEESAAVPASRGGGGLSVKVAAGFLVLILLGAGGLFVAAKRDAAIRGKLLAALPEQSRGRVEALLGAPPPEEPAPAASVPQTPKGVLRKFIEHLPPVIQSSAMGLLRAFNADQPEEYSRVSTEAAGMVDAAPTEAIGLRAMGLLAQGFSLYRYPIEGGSWDDLLAKAATLKDASPSDPVVLAAYGMALLGRGQSEEAAAVVGQILAREPQDPVALYIRGQSGGSIEDLRAASAAEPKFVAASIALARALVAAGQASEAKEILEKALAGHPDHPGVKQMLEAEVGPALGASVRGAETVAAAPAAGAPVAPAPAKETAPEDPVQLYEQGKALYGQKQFAPAEAIFVRVLDQYYDKLGREKAAIIHYLLGEIYLTQGKTGDAKAQYEASLTVAPNFKKAKDRLDSLRGPSRAPSAPANP